MDNDEKSSERQRRSKELDLLNKSRKGWPEGYFEEVVGCWRNESIEPPSELELEEREPFD